MSLLNITHYVPESDVSMLCSNTAFELTLSSTPVVVLDSMRCLVSVVRPPAVPSASTIHFDAEGK